MVRPSTHRDRCLGLGARCLYWPPAPSGTERVARRPVASFREKGLAGKVLVVDDDASVQRLLQFTLKQEGYDV